MLKYFSKLILLFVVSSLVFAPLVHACASCGFNDDSSPYFLIFVVIMTSLPVLFIGSVVLYLKKHSEKTAKKIGLEKPPVEIETVEMETRRP